VDGVGFEDLILLAAILALLTCPVVRMIRRMGRSGWWVLAFMTPALTSSRCTSSHSCAGRRSTATAGH